MSTARKLDSIAAGFHRAVSQGSFEEGRRWLGEYAAELNQELHAGQAGTAEIKTAQALFDWARRNTLAARSHTAQQLSGALVAACYFGGPRQAPSTLDLRG